MSSVPAACHQRHRWAGAPQRSWKIRYQARAGCRLGADSRRYRLRLEGTQEVVRLLAAVLLAALGCVAGCSSNSNGTKLPSSASLPSALGGQPTAPVTSPASAPQSGTPVSSLKANECSTGQLTLHEGFGQGAMQRYDQTYYFVNRSSNSCVMAGFPGIHYLDRSGSPMRHSTTRGGGFAGYSRAGYKSVTLPPGGRASFALDAYDYDARANRNCPLSAFLAVYPPDNRVRIVIKVHEAVCGDPVAVSPIRRFRPQDAQPSN